VTQDEAFLQSIREDPDDDGLRLIYADWLEERGDPRGEFIRVQVELARTPSSDPRVPLWREREAQLLEAHWDAWTLPLRELLVDDRLGVPREVQIQRKFHLRALREWFRRGFPEKLQLEVRTFVERGEALLRAAPLRHLCLWGAGEGASALARCPQLATIETLEFNDYFRSPLDAAGMHELAAAQYLSRLRCLLLYRNNLGDAGAAALASAPWFADLRVLHLGDNGLSAEGVAALVSSPHFDGLTDLDLNHNTLGPSGGNAFRRRRHPGRLTGLNLDRCGLGDGGVRNLARSPRLATVERLVLSGNGITDQGATALAASSLLRGLRVLDLGSNAISEAGRQTLRDSPHLRQLAVPPF
jgi:uncharacterized protein (TIGR02996 family)